MRLSFIVGAQPSWLANVWLMPLNLNGVSMFCGVIKHLSLTERR